ncbi:LacI family DNA-binding transcriptional regulator [Pelagicoccus enzymogenes]|uniref:LacI family DNA-binding transcriptional regulator n=1 Tax=Pelagicoccus enzymogenes TaxID=2773457 RepID=UPI00280C7340|nr:LacI family DNA-binding transcriptional regulator [Pelagicoccus enzymogenes]MDQ8199648.1 LacI family DNA-binding transcriptional regulator [Pelagicoccus enzymogenes]
MGEEQVGRGRRKKATIYDLADATGFSSGTVSRVLNNRSNVAAETRDIILKAAREMNLQPQLSARLKQVAVVADASSGDRMEGYASTLISHLAYALSKKSFAVSFPEDPQKQLSTQFVDAIVAVSCGPQLQPLLQGFEKQLPVVYLDKFDCAPEQHAVVSDHYQAGVLAAEHFIARGKTKLAFYSKRSLPHAERLRGYRDAMESAGVKVDDYRLLMEESDSLMAAVTRIVRNGADALYVPGSSFQAMEVLHLLSYVMGVRVPEDISVIGGENAVVSKFMSPPLTTIAEPLEEMANAVASLLEGLMQGQAPAQRTITLPVELIERNSVFGD